MTEGKWKPGKKEHDLTIWCEYSQMPQLLNVTKELRKTRRVRVRG